MRYVFLNNNVLYRADVDKEVVVKEQILFNAHTPNEVITALEAARITHQRIRIWYGFTETGASWEVETDNLGYVNYQPWGNVNIPILVHNDRTGEGRRLADQDIIKIVMGKRCVYEHPNFNQPSYGFDLTKNAFPDYQKFEHELDFPWVVYKFIPRHALKQDGSDAYEVVQEKVVAKFQETKEGCIRWIQYMTGERMSMAGRY